MGTFSNKILTGDDCKQRDVWGKEAQGEPHMGLLVLRDRYNKFLTAHRR